jgi:hypothetical protein
MAIIMERGADAFCLGVVRENKSPGTFPLRGFFGFFRSMNVLSSVVVVPHALQAFFDL